MLIKLKQGPIEVPQNVAIGLIRGGIAEEVKSGNDGSFEPPPEVDNRTEPLSITLKPPASNKQEKMVEPEEPEEDDKREDESV